MGTEISNYIGGQLPSVDAHVREIALGYYSKVIEERRGKPMLPELPNALERKRMHEASLSLGDALRGISYSVVAQGRAAQAIGGMLAGYRNIKEQEPAKLVAAYCTHLKDLPLYAIEAACDEVKKGGALAKKMLVNPAFPPSHAQLYQIADAICDTVREEKARIDLVLSVKEISAPVISDEKRAEVKSNIEALAKSMKAAREKERSVKREASEAFFQEFNVRDIIREYEAAGVEPYFGKDGGLVALGTLMSLGATIEKSTGGTKVLVIPRRN